MVDKINPFMCVEQISDGITDSDNRPAAELSTDKTPAPMDLDKILKEFDDDEDFLKGLLQKFLENVKGQILAMRKALSDGNVEVVRREAHSIKGGAGNLTAEDLSCCALELERQAGNGNIQGSINALKRLEEEFLRLEAFAYKC